MKLGAFCNIVNRWLVGVTSLWVTFTMEELNCSFPDSGNGRAAAGPTDREAPYSSETQLSR